MQLKRFNTGDGDFSTRFSCAEEALLEVKNLFFKDQLSEEEILIELYSPNSGEVTFVDQNRLNLDYVFSKRQIKKKCMLGRFKFVDSFKYQNDYSIRTILNIKNEQRRLGVDFKGYFILSSKRTFGKSKEEPLLFVAVGNDTYYVLNDFLTGQETKLKSKRSLKKIFHWIQNRTFLKTFYK